ncbi:MAG: DUF427 domain-containing protein [Acidimicrobiia bacterium]|nr:DUF427 domain-containing protein [Acidimicrobiia bacterium]
MTSAQPSSDLRIELNHRRIRGMWRGQTVVDTTASRFVWEHAYYPAWYIPSEDIAGELVANGETFESARRGIGTRIDVDLGEGSLDDAGWRHLDAPDEELRGLVRLEWDALDSWFEEDVEVFVHPRSPEVRIDVLPSSRHVRVLVEGEVVAESARARILHETGLTPRFYVPQTDVRMDLMTPTDTSSGCPYKGWANYWSLTIGDTTYDDIAWGYRTPLPESRDVAGLVCFFNDRVAIEVDGARL